MKTIGLTSPHTKGADVKRVQSALKKNWTKTDFLQGLVDGDFGTGTARACIRAKYWLGYPTAKQQPFAGDQLVHLLAAEANLSFAYRARRKARLKAAQQKPLRVKALERAEKDLGMKEQPPGSNRCPISDRWGVTGPWCAMAVSTWYIDAGSKAFTLHTDWAYVPALLSAAALGQHGLSLTLPTLAQPGDIVTFDWDDDGIADHAGLLRSTIAKAGKFTTIEGNTSASSNSNGGEVQHRDRYLSDVAKHNGVLGIIHVAK